jgi:hypothetical protein
MKKQQKIDRTGGRYRIECYYAPEVLVPHEAIERKFYETAKPWTDDLFVTQDGKVCRPEFVASWSEIEDEKMNGFCEPRWGMKFSTVRSLWFERLKIRYGLRAWHFIRLHELE